MPTDFFQRPVRVLHLEDNENDQILVREMLHADGLSCDIVPVKTKGEFESFLQRGTYDVIISDFSIPSYDGLSALSISRKMSPQTPFIFFSGTIGEEVAVESLKNGATDYVLKQRPHRLAGAVRNALRNLGERLRRQQAESELRNVEEQFLRAQRLESLGMLVSGIAHDLNNALVPIIVGVDILRSETASADAEMMLQTMETSARRSADMVRQMLAFARGGEETKTTFQADTLIKEISKIISATFPKSIQCRIRAEKNSYSVSGLPTQLHQVLLNLSVNARDAMPDGGTLTLATKNIKLSAEEAAQHKGAHSGNYLCISVADTGHGISETEMPKIFQPFFTTKVPGKGTGLGLSTCQSIVKNHNGFITVESKVNAGTEFKIYLPAAGNAEPEQSDLRKTPPPAGNGERILVVDDEESILAITRAALENFGYNVLTEKSGLEAVARFSEKSSSVDLVITDLAMPFMDGLATIDGIRKIRPETKIIIASGSDKEIEEAKRTVQVEAFVAKPFTSDELLKAVHEVLTRRK
jgi:hypothetical protein